MVGALFKNVQWGDSSSEFHCLAHHMMCDITCKYSSLLYSFCCHLDTQGYTVYSPSQSLSMPRRPKKAYTPRNEHAQLSNPNTSPDPITPNTETMPVMQSVDIQVDDSCMEANIWTDVKTVLVDDCLSDDEWAGVKCPSTWDERAQERQERKTRTLTALQIVLMRKAECYLDGPIDRAGGAKDKTGKKRGCYNIGGISERTAREKRARLDTNILHPGGDPSLPNADLMRCKQSIKVRSRPKGTQTSLRLFFGAPFSRLSSINLGRPSWTVRHIHQQLGKRRSQGIRGGV